MAKTHVTTGIAAKTNDVDKVEDTENVGGNYRERYATLVGNDLTTPLVDEFTEVPMSSV